MNSQFLPRITQRLRPRCHTALALCVLTIAFGATAGAKVPRANTAVRDSKEIKSAVQKRCPIETRARVPQFDPCYRFMWRYR